jgi:hypothetical protein
MKSLTIEIPAGHEIDSFDKANGVIKFKEKPKNVMERIKTIADVIADNGLTQEQFDRQCEGLTEDEVSYRIIKMLAKSLNEGWTPNCNNENEYKFYPWFWMGGARGFRSHDYDFWDSGSRASARLCFKSKELAEYAGNQFTDVYKKYMTI